MVMGRAMRTFINVDDGMEKNCDTREILISKTALLVWENGYERTKGSCLGVAALRNCV